MSNLSEVKCTEHLVAPFYCTNQVFSCIDGLNFTADTLSTHVGLKCAQKCHHDAAAFRNTDLPLNAHAEASGDEKLSLIFARLKRIKTDFGVVFH